MPTATPPRAGPKFCSECGTQLNAGARFCQNCGFPVQGGRSTSAPAAAPGGVSNALRWVVPGLAIVALAMLVVTPYGSRGSDADAGARMPLGGGAMGAPDISSMSPQERADRLFNRVMRLASEGKPDSAAFFGPMAVSSIEALAPLDAHQRYDLGLVALVMGDGAMAKAQADTILAQRPTHLLGLALAARAADARGDSVAARDSRGKLLAAESVERARGLPEYRDHDADIRAAVDAARKR